MLPAKSSRSAKQGEDRKFVRLSARRRERRLSNFSSYNAASNFTFRMGRHSLTNCRNWASHTVLIRDCSARTPYARNRTSLLPVSKSSKNTVHACGHLLNAHYTGMRKSTSLSRPNEARFGQAYTPGDPKITFHPFNVAEHFLQDSP